MLQNIRDHIQGWIAGVIIALLGAAFVLWGLEYYINQGSGAQAVIAKVNGVKITEADLNRAFQNALRRQQAERKITLTNQQQEQLKQFTLKGLIANAGLRQAALQHGFDVSIPLVQRIVMGMPGLQVKGQFSPERFQQLLFANSLTQTQFFNHVRDNLVIGQVEGGILASAFMLPSETALAYQLLKQTRSFGYFVIPNAKFAKGVTVSSADVKKFYQDNARLYQIPAKASVSYILLSPKDLRKQVTATAQEVKQYYEGNETNYTVPKRWQVAQLMVSSSNPNAQKIVSQLVAALKKGTTFDALSKQTIAGMTAKTQWVGEEQLTGDYRTAVAQMTVGQVSRPIKTDKGIVIAKVLAVTPEKVRPFDSVKKAIRNTLIQQKTERLISKMSEELSNLTYTNPTTLSVAAKALGVQVQTSPMITRQGMKTGLLSNQKVLNLAFSNEVFKQGNNSNPIELKDGGLLVVRIAKKIPSKLMPLSAVSAKIKQQLTQQVAARQAGVMAFKVQNALASGQTPSSLASKYGLTWKTKSNVQRLSKGVSPALLQAVFSLSSSGVSKKPATSVEMGNGDYAVVQLLKVNLPEPDTISAKALMKLGDSLARYMGQLSYRFYAKGVLDNTKVKIYKSQ